MAMRRMNVNVRRDLWVRLVRSVRNPFVSIPDGALYSCEKCVISIFYISFSSLDDIDIPSFKKFQKFLFSFCMHSP